MTMTPTPVRPEQFTVPGARPLSDERVTRKVRHAMASWQERDTFGNVVVMSAFRGQQVDMPKSEADRLEKYGALIPVDIDLERPGDLQELPEEVSDEELIAWVLSASPAEVLQLAKARPELAPRLNGALERITNERAVHDEHLRVVQRALQGLPPGEDPAAAIGDDGRVFDNDIILANRKRDVDYRPPEQRTPLSGDDDLGADDGPGIPGEAADLRTDGYLEQPASGGHDDEEPDDGGEVVDTTDFSLIVSGNVDDVAGYLAGNPEHVEQVLSAEIEYRGRSGRDPRTGVLTAVEVARAHVAE